MIYSMLGIVWIYIFLYIRICLQVSTGVYIFLEIRYALSRMRDTEGYGYTPGFAGG